jgi:hypothetical protein
VGDDPPHVARVRGDQGQRVDGAAAGREEVDRAGAERVDDAVQVVACSSTVIGAVSVGLRPAPRGSYVTTGRSVTRPSSVPKPLASIGEPIANRAGRSAVAADRSPWTSYVTAAVPSPTVRVVVARGGVVWVMPAGTARTPRTHRCRARAERPPWRCVAG